MSEFTPQGPSPESEQRTAPPDALTLPFEGNPWVDLDKNSYQVVLHIKDGEKPIESGYQAILELAKEQGKDPEEAVAAVISSLRSEQEAGLAKIGKTDEAAFDHLSDQYGKRLGLFLGNERIRVLPGARHSEDPSLAEISWKSMFWQGLPLIRLDSVQPNQDIKFHDTRNKRAAQATRQAIVRIEKGFGITSKYRDERSGIADDNAWHFTVPKVKQNLLSLNRGLYVHMAGGYREINTFRPGQLAFGDELLPEKNVIEFPDPIIVAECNRIYNEEMQALKKKKQS